MCVALCHINPIIGDFAYNTALIQDATENAKRAGCSLGQ
jgi:predicted amidohydrolase